MKNFYIAFLLIIIVSSACFSEELNYDGCNEPYTTTDGNRWGIQMFGSDQIAVRATPLTTGVLTGIKIFCELKDIPSRNCSMKVHIYADNNGEPGDELLESMEVQFSEGDLSPGWHNFVFNPQYN